MGEFPRKPDGRGVFPVEFEPGVLKSCATRPPRASVLAQRGGGADDCNICLGTWERIRFPFKSVTDLSTRFGSSPTNQLT
jgi:hypothetical protein